MWDQLKNKRADLRQKEIEVSTYNSIFIIDMSIG